MTIRASVIIPTYSDWSRLELCLRALKSQSIPSSEFEIIVGNNDPDCDVPSDLEVPGNCSFVTQPRPGSYAARNLAVSASTAPVLFFTDSDCIPHERWIEEGLAILGGDEGTDRIGGAVQMFPKGAHWTAAESYDRIFSLTQERYVSKGYSVTANLIVSRELFEQVGPFNEDLLSGGDKEWNLRATAQGHRICYAPSAVVFHPARASFLALGSGTDSSSSPSRRRGRGSLKASATSRGAVDRDSSFGSSTT